MDILDLIGKEHSYIAHPEERLEEHVEKCLQNAKRICKQKGLKRIFCFFLDFFNCTARESSEYSIIKEFIRSAMEDIIALHDIGKVNPLFQKKLGNKEFTNQTFSNGIGSQHSIVSAVLYLDYYLMRLKKLGEDNSSISSDQKNKLCHFLYLNSYLISRHHSNLSSFELYMQDFELECGKMQDRVEEIRNDILPSCKPPYPFLDNNIVLKWAKRVKKGKTDCCEDNICIYIYQRLLFSVLLACDYYATSAQTTGVYTDSTGEIEDCQAFLKAYEEGHLNRQIRSYQLNTYQNGNNSVSEITTLNALRCELFLDAEQGLFQHSKENLFYLEAPTGIGKSNTAFNLSFQLMKENKELNKLFYIYPFNTLVEQNEAILSKIYKGHESLLSQIHVVNSLHSLIKGNKDELREESYQRLLLDRQFLNYPITLSTHVTLFDILFSARKEAVFSFHQLANSVIVLDEIQSYKNSIWTELITFFQVFAKVLNIRFLIMSATLPDLSQLVHTEQLPVQLIQDHNKYYQHPLIRNRSLTKYDLLYEKASLERLFDCIAEKLEENKKVLVEFITKKSAEKFYKYVIEQYGTLENVRLLTGDDNVIDRKRILSDLEHSKKEEPFLLIATQVVEAGVDINNIEVGFKDCSILDAEEQFKGRINRSCDIEHIGEVFFFSLDNAHNVYRGDARVESTLTISNTKMQEILEEKDFEHYYKIVMEQIQKLNENADEHVNIHIFFEEVVRDLDAQIIEQRMKLIDEDEWRVNVFFNRTIKIDSQTIVGREVWERYKTILLNGDMDYAKRQVLLMDIRIDMSYFIYPVNARFIFEYDERNCEQIGEIYYIDEAEKYFENGRFDREKFENQGQLIL